MRDRLRYRLPEHQFAGAQHTKEGSAVPAIDKLVTGAQPSADHTVSGETQLFRDAMASFPSGVTIVTTTDATDRWWGFTATSFCSVSLEPPLVLVCLAHTAQCHPVFVHAARWVVHIIHTDDSDLATRFATRGTDKFRNAGFTVGPEGLPVLDRACVRLDCTRHATYAAGDHTILLGRVEHARVGDTAPAVYFRRAFHTIRTA